MDELNDMASTQEVNPPQPFAPLNWIRADAALEFLEDFRLFGLAHGFILVALGRCAEMVVYAEQDILDGDTLPITGEVSIGENRETPGKIINTECRMRQWRYRGERAEDSWRQGWVVLGGKETDIV
jgi:hypothetical protein